ncbi:MAG TPA: RNA polymerase sigma factor [Candidatus Limnocylindrales bacterium]
MDGSLEVTEVRDGRTAGIDQRDARAAAFVRLADEHLDGSYRLARAILRDPYEAQDATHDAYVQAWRKWSTLRDHSKFEAWFDRILVNTCRNRLVRGPRTVSTDLSIEIVASSHDPIGQTDDRETLGRALAGLSPDHRIVVALRYFRDLPIEEIATRLGVPAGTVQSRLHYALKRLHAALDEPGSKGLDR